MLSSYLSTNFSYIYMHYISSSQVSLSWTWSDGVGNAAIDALGTGPGPLASALQDDNGGSRLTGFRVYAYPGAGPVTQTTPYPVVQCVQTVTLAGAQPSPSVQVITFINATSGSFALLYTAPSAVSGVLTLSARTASIDLASPTLGFDVTAALNALCGASGLSAVCGASASVGGIAPVVNITVVFAAPALQPLLAVEDESLASAGGATISAFVSMLLPGGGPLDGEFTLLSYSAADGSAHTHTQETAPIAVGASASELAAALEALPSVGRVAVEVLSSDPPGGAGGLVYAVTFLSAIGDVSPLGITDGLLTGFSPSARVAVTQHGSPAYLAWDGSASPNARSATLSGLTPGASYAFSLRAINAVGEGLPGPASLTVLTRAGASASHTTASGSALVLGIAGVRYEQQSIRLVCSGCTHADVFSLSFGGGPNVSVHSDATASEVEAALTGATFINARGVRGSIDALHVTRAAAAPGGFTWTLTFTQTSSSSSGGGGGSSLGSPSAPVWGDAGSDLPLCTLSTAGVLAGTVISAAVQEVQHSTHNAFTIEPKTVTGDIVRDGDDPDGLSGTDVFFTELWAPQQGQGHSGTAATDTRPLDGTQIWSSDGGVAMYSPPVYEVQVIISNGGPTRGAFNLSFDVGALLGGTSNMLTISAPLPFNATALDVATALETIPAVGAVHVDRTTLYAPANGSPSGYAWSVTFLSTLGALPRLIATPDGSFNGALNVTTADDGAAGAASGCSHGITEVQTITTFADAPFVSEVQTITTLSLSGIAGGAYNVSFGGVSVTVSALASSATLSAALQSLPGLTTVSVALTANLNGAGVVIGSVWTITFLDPLGPVGPLTVLDVGLTPAAPSTSVKAETLRAGAAPLTGTYVLGWGGAITPSLPVNASAAAMASAISALPGVSPGVVAVTRAPAANGYAWTVTFVNTPGNLPLLSAQPRTLAVQSLSTGGGWPTPLSGTFTLALAGASSSRTPPLPYDVSSDRMAAALSALPGTGGDVRVSRVGPLGPARTYTWTVTFAGVTGAVLPLSVDGGELSGTAANITVRVVIPGVAFSLTGPGASVRVEEAVAGTPSYSGSYLSPSIGRFSLAVRQLVPGGLHGDYFDNQWLQGPPAASRVDSVIDFDWGTGLITPYGRDYVSVRWTGKMRAPSSEALDLFLTADTGARLYVNHVLLIDAWEGATSSPSSSSVSSRQTSTATTLVTERVTLNVTGGAYNDIILEYREVRGAALITLEWASPSLARSVIPADALFAAYHIVGSPFALRITPGDSDYPQTTAYGAGLSSAIAGTPSVFVIQAKDALGNNKTTGGDVFSVSIAGQGEAFSVTPVYAGGASGRYIGTYTAFRAGAYTLSIRMGVAGDDGAGGWDGAGVALVGGGTDVYCGLGAVRKCSPFSLTVAPGPAVAASSYTSQLASAGQNGLSGGTAGETQTFSIFALDTYGNPRDVGGDDFTVLLSPLVPGTPAYRGDVADNGDGTYTASYTALTAGTYTLDVRLGGEAVFPAGLDTPALVTIVFADLHPGSCDAYGPALGSNIYNPLISGVATSLTIESRDTFGNLRSGGGNSATMLDGFLVSATSASTGRVVLASSVTLQLDIVATGGSFTLVFDGAATEALSFDIDAHALQFVLTRLGAADSLSTPPSSTSSSSSTSRALLPRGFIVTSAPPSNASPALRTLFISLTSGMDAWSTSSAWVDGSALTLAGGSAAGSVSMAATPSAVAGEYPVSFTLYDAGAWRVDVTAGGYAIAGSPFDLYVAPGPIDASSTLAYGSGLLGGQAGSVLSLTVSARDTRVPDVQTFMVDSVVSNSAPEVRVITCTSAASLSTVAFSLSWAGQASPAVPSSASPVAAGAILASHPWIAALGGSVTVTLPPGVVSLCAPSAGGGGASPSATITIAGLGRLDGLGWNSVGVGAASITDDSTLRIPGATPARLTVHGFTCSSPSATAIITFRSASVTIPLLDPTWGTPLSVAGFITAVAPLLGVVSVSALPPGGLLLSPSAPLCTSPFGTNYSITYVTLTGDVEPPASSDPLLVLTPIIPGISPHWGSFTLALGGSTSPSLPFDVSAAALTTALSSGMTPSSTIGHVAVSRSALGNDGLGRPTRFLYSLTFNAPGGTQPSNHGPVPLIDMDTSGIQWSDGGQRPPIALVAKAVDGSVGNARPDGSDGHLISARLQVCSCILLLFIYNGI